jgi:hypothetical protein
MKHLKTGLLVMMSLFIVIATTILSCSKSDNPAPPVTPAPTITSFTPASASTGGTVTITGTNFTGATSVSFGGTAATSYTVVSATSITAVLGTGATGTVKVATAGGAATKDGFTFTAPQIDGYDNSNQVGKDSLQAHWSFDVDNREDISTKVPEKAVGASSLDAGVIGKGLKLTAGYLVFPVIPNLSSADALPNFTVSLWVNSPNSSASMSSFFQMTGEVFPDIWGQIQLAANTHWGKGGDTLALDGRLIQINGTGVHDDGFWDPTPGTFIGANKWSLLSITYDGPSHTLKYYGDGLLIDTRVTTVVVDPETFILQQPSRVLVGTFAYKEDGFANSYTALGSGHDWAGHGISASLDDIRVFNASLSDTQIKALYDLGKAGR